MNTGDLRVAIVGYGLAGAVFHAPLVAATPGLCVTGIVTANPTRQAAAHAAYPQAAILPDVDVLWAQPAQFDLIVVATPNRTHVPLALRSIEAGVPVVVDKPLASSSHAARDLIETSETKGVPLTVFQNRRWDGDFLTLQRLIQRGLLGPIVRYESRFERYRPAPKPGAWRELPDPEEGGGLLFDLGSHLIDQAILLFGRPRQVYAEIAVRRPGVHVDDDTFVALHFDHDVTAHLWMNVVVRLLGPRLYASGLRGSFRIEGLDPQEQQLSAGLRPGDPSWGARPPDRWGHLSTEVEGLHLDGAVEPLPGRYQEFYAQMAVALRGQGPVPVDPRDALLTLTIIEAAQTSAQHHRLVSLDSEGRPT